jgi:spermidine/putrescine transport system permease protein
VSQDALPRPAAFSTQPKRPRAFRVGYLPGFGLWTLLVFLYLYAPLVILVVFSFNDNRAVTVWRGFTLAWYGTLLGNVELRRAALTSLGVAAVATGVATAVATLAALVLVRGGPFRGRQAVGALLLSPLMIPEIVTAVATLAFFALLGVSLGVGRVVLAHCVFCIPFAFLPIRARLQSLDRSLEAAAQDLYASPWRVFRRVTLPLLAPGIAAGALLAFIISLDDFVITLMVAEPGTTTLPLYIYGLVRLGVTPEVNAVSSAMLVLSILVVTLSLLLQRR